MSEINASLGILGAWMLIGRFIQGPARTAGTLLLLLTTLYSFNAPRFNANTFQLSIWPWTTYFFVRSVEDRTVRMGVLFGLFSGLAILSKYYAILLLASCFVAAVQHEHRRAYFLSPARWVAFLTFELVLDQDMVHFDPSRLLDLGASVLVAFLLATAIGAERQYRQRSAGLRTNLLVAVGAATFVSVGSRLNGDAGAAQLASYFVSGIDFLGAGVIMKEGSKVCGLNTAATLWCSAAVGTLSGIGLMAEAVVVTAAVLAGNTLLRPLVNAINRALVDERTSEASYDVQS